MAVDWADGDYERTAADLQPAAAALVDYAGVGPGQHVLDVGCGTGNATVAAARAGARVTAIDPSEGLLEIARDRVATLDADITFLQGAGEALPVATATADVALSVFGVIFAERPSAAAAEMRRATRPGGTVALTSWRSTGAIAETGKALVARMPPREGPAPRWGEDPWVTELLTSAGLVGLEIEEETLAFRSESPEAFLDAFESDHPSWRAVLRTLSAAGRDALHEESLAALRAGNEAPEAFLTTSTYALIRASVPVEG